MQLLNRKTQLQRVLGSVGDTLEGASGKALKAGLLAAGGLAALTAGSAGISSLRNRLDGEGR
jgi:hypothetical protein